MGTFWSVPLLAAVHSLEFAKENHIVWQETEVINYVKKLSGHNNTTALKQGCPTYVFIIHDAKCSLLGGSSHLVSGL